MLGIPPTPGQPMQVGGTMVAMGNAAIERIEREKAEETNSQPVILNLAAHVRKAWERNLSDKRSVEQRMLKSLRQRQGQYDPDVLAKLREQESSEVFMMISSAKARAISSWLRDALMANGTEKPWTISPTPIPEMPPELVMTMLARSAQVLQQAVAAGLVVDAEAVFEEQRAAVMEEISIEASETTKRMEDHMEDQLVEGGFMRALSDMVDDLVTFPSAIVKGPVIREKQVTSWAQDETGSWTVVKEPKLVEEWERVDPFLAYPSPGAVTCDDGEFIELHRLSRSTLKSLENVEGYSASAIRAVLDEHGRGGLREWATNIDHERALAEGRDTYHIQPNGMIDALQYWGNVQGKFLLDWGVPKEQVEDPTAEYQAEVWLIGRWVIKARLNNDPCARRGYFKVSWEGIPGAFWGNSPMDQLADAQVVCNAAARSLVNNMGIASGPQTWLDVDRVPQGAEISTMHPWKLWQVTSDKRGNSSAAPPMGFFQPASNAAELMAIYEKFAAIADDVVGVPKYMSGAAPGGNVGRSATGMSMLAQHASKVLQQVVGQIDLMIFTPLLEHLYMHNMLHSPDNSIKGDARVQARGAKSLIARESAMVRRTEFLAQTNNPTDLQITGLEGRATVLREVAKTLDMPADKIVPAGGAMAMRGMPPPGPQQALPGQGQQLDNGAPVANSFQ